MNTLPPLADLVVRRDGVARQMRGRLTSVAQGNDLNQDPPEDYHKLTACIECYACLQGCPMHARNFEDSNDLGASKGYRHGNPFSLLKLQMLRIDPLSSEAGRERALEHAKDLGLDACRDCKGCKCGVGIDLMGKVVRPLLAAAGSERFNTAQSPPDALTTRPLTPDFGLEILDVDLRHLNDDLIAEIDALWVARTGVVGAGSVVGRGAADRILEAARGDQHSCADGYSLAQSSGSGDGLELTSGERG